MSKAIITLPAIPPQSRKRPADALRSMIRPSRISRTFVGEVQQRRVVSRGDDADALLPHHFREQAEDRPRVR